MIGRILAVIYLCLLGTLATADNNAAYFNEPFYEGSARDIIFHMLSNQKTTLVLTSSGGYVNEGFILGNFIRNENISVIIRERCASACSVAAMAATDLTMEPDSALYFHTPYLTEVRTDQTIKSMLLEHSVYMNDMNIWFNNNGFSFEFWKLILVTTDINRYVKIDSVADLDAFKSTSYMSKIPVFSNKYTIHVD